MAINSCPAKCKYVLEVKEILTQFVTIIGNMAQFKWFIPTVHLFGSVLCTLYELRGKEVTSLITDLGLKHDNEVVIQERIKTLHYSFICTRVNVIVLLYFISGIFIHQTIQTIQTLAA